MKDKDGGNDSDSSSESDSSDDDEAAYNPKFDEEFLKTLSSLKRKDDAIYEKSTKFFEEENILEKPSNLLEKKEGKKLTIKQYEQERLLKNGGVFEDDDEAGTEAKRSESPTFNEEQKMIKSEFKRVLDSDDSDDGGDFGGLFTKRQKTKTEQVFSIQCLWIISFFEETEFESLIHFWHRKRMIKSKKTG